MKSPIGSVGSADAPALRPWVLTSAAKETVMRRMTCLGIRPERSEIIDIGIRGVSAGSACVLTADFRCLRVADPADQRYVVSANQRLIRYENLCRAPLGILIGVHSKGAAD